MSPVTGLKLVIWDRVAMAMLEKQQVRLVEVIYDCKHRRWYLCRDHGTFMSGFAHARLDAVPCVVSTEEVVDARLRAHVVRVRDILGQYLCLPPTCYYLWHERFRLLGRRLVDIYSLIFDPLLS